MVDSLDDATRMIANRKHEGENPLGLAKVGYQELPEVAAYALRAGNDEVQVIAHEFEELDRDFKDRNVWTDSKLLMWVNAGFALCRGAADQSKAFLQKAREKADEAGGVAYERLVVAVFELIASHDACYRPGPGAYELLPKRGGPGE